MQDFAKPFYMSPQWRSAREAAWKRAGGLCEICMKKGLITPAEIVHHRIPITRSNIGNPRITLSLDNLMAVCRDCHAELHKRKHRYTVDEQGHVMALED